MRGWNGALVTLMLLSMGTVMGIAVWKATFALARTFFRPWSANWCTLAVVNIFASIFCPAVAFFSRREHRPLALRTDVHHGGRPLWYGTALSSSSESAHAGRPQTDGRDRGVQDVPRRG